MLFDQSKIITKIHLVDHIFVKSQDLLVTFVNLPIETVNQVLDPDTRSWNLEFLPFIYILSYLGCNCFFF